MHTFILIVKMLMGLTGEKLRIVYCCAKRLRESYGEDQRWLYLFRRFLSGQPCWLENIILTLDTESGGGCHCTPSNKHFLVYTLTGSATNIQLFLSLSNDLQSLCLSDEDIDYIANTFREGLARRGNANLFLVEDKDKGEFIVKDVRLYDGGGYNEHTHWGLWGKHPTWEEHHHIRVVVQTIRQLDGGIPQYTFRPSYWSLKQ